MVLLNVLKENEEIKKVEGIKSVSGLASYATDMLKVNNSNSLSVAYAFRRIKGMVKKSTKDGTPIYYSASDIENLCKKQYSKSTINAMVKALDYCMKRECVPSDFDYVKINRYAKLIDDKKITSRKVSFAEMLNMSMAELNSKVPKDSNDSKNDKVEWLEFEIGGVKYRCKKDNAQVQDADGNWK